MRRVLADGLNWIARLCAIGLIVVAIIALIKGDDRWPFAIVGALVCLGVGHFARYFVMVCP